MIEKQFKDDCWYAWEYFSLHARQRTLLFNIYIFFISTFSYATAHLILVHISNNCSVKPYEYYLVFLLGMLLFLVTFTFHKLDIRNKELIDNAKQGLVELEKKNQHMPQIFLRNENSKTFFKHSVCFNIIFYTGYIIATAYIIFSIIKLNCPRTDACKMEGKNAVYSLPENLVPCLNCYIQQDQHY